MRVDNGQIAFRPLLLRRSEFLPSCGRFHLFDIHGDPLTIELEPNTLAFTYCQVPVIYHGSADRKIGWTQADGQTCHGVGDRLSREVSAAIVDRTGQIRRVDVFTTPGQ